MGTDDGDEYTWLGTRTFTPNSPSFVVPEWLSVNDVASLQRGVGARNAANFSPFVRQVEPILDADIIDIEPLRHPASSGPGPMNDDIYSGIWTTRTAAENAILIERSSNEIHQDYLRNERSPDGAVGNYDTLQSTFAK
jgi:hypothetical protein